MLVHHSKEREAVIVSSVRTPVGRIGGKLQPVSCGDLAAIAIKEAVKRSGIDPNDIGDVIFGNLYNTEMTNIGRYVALNAGLPMAVPGIGLDRGCASSLNACAYGMAMIESGHEDILVVGGAESDSNRNWIMRKPEKVYQVAPPKMMLSGIAAPGKYGVTMGETAENVGRKWGITRVECDAFAVESHKKASAAQEKGLFDEQIVPVTVSTRKAEYTVTQDECVRPETNMEVLAKLKPSFSADGIVTAGNSSAMSDGASAMVMMPRSMAEASGAERMYRFVDFTSAGVDPRYMGEGPIEAIRKLMNKIGVSFKDIDLIELNEAFATQCIACIRGLDLPEDKLNVNGGAIALGHPLAATGGVLIAKLIYELERRDLSTGLVSFCIGGGQGSAGFIERIR